MRAWISTRSIAWMRPTKSAVRAIGFRSAVTVPTGTAAGPGCCATTDAASPQASTAAPANMRIAVRQRRTNRGRNRDRRGRSFSTSVFIVLIGKRNPAAGAERIDVAMKATGTRSLHDLDNCPAQLRTEQLDRRRGRRRCGPASSAKLFVICPSRRSSLHLRAYSRPDRSGCGRSRCDKGGIRSDHRQIRLPARSTSGCSGPANDPRGHHDAQPLS